MAVVKKKPASADMGGSPSDKPAGPFILRGPCAKFW